MEYSGARGTLINEKKPKSKISCQTPFNVCLWMASIFQSFVHLGSKGETGALLGEDSEGGAGGAVGGHQGPAGLWRVRERRVVQALHAG